MHKGHRPESSDDLLLAIGGGLPLAGRADVLFDEAIELGSLMAGFHEVDILGLVTQSAGDLGAVSFRHCRFNSILTATHWWYQKWYQINLIQ